MEISFKGKKIKIGQNVQYHYLQFPLLKSTSEDPWFTIEYIKKKKRISKRWESSQHRKANEEDYFLNKREKTLNYDKN